MDKSRCVIYGCRNAACKPIDEIRLNESGGDQPPEPVQAQGIRTRQTALRGIVGRNVRGVCSKHLERMRKSAQMPKSAMTGHSHHAKITKNPETSKSRRTKKTVPKLVGKCSVYACSLHAHKQTSADAPKFCKKHLQKHYEQEELANKISRNAANVSDGFVLPTVFSPRKKIVCFVSGCTNTTLKSGKSFFRVPTSPKLRAQWLQAANINDYKFLVNLMHCCQDHFSFPDDFCPGTNILVKGALPRISTGTVPTYIDTDHTYVSTTSIPPPKMSDKFAHTQESLVSAAHDGSDLQSSTPISASSPEESDQSFEISIKSEPMDEDLRRLDEDATENGAYLENETEKSFDENKSVSDLASFKLKLEPTSENQYDFIPNSMGRLLDHMRSNSTLYLGVHPDVLPLLEVLWTKLKINERDLLLTLRWIRLREPFVMLSFTFELAEDDDSKRIVVRTVPLLSSVLRPLLEAEPHLKAVVQCVVGCIESVVPNPYRVLLSCLDDGTINFVSTAFFNPISNKKLLLKSGLCDVLQTTLPVVFVDGLDDGEDYLLDEQFDHLVIWNQSTENALPDRTHVVEQMRQRWLVVRNSVQEFACFKLYERWDNNDVALLSGSMVIAAAMHNMQTLPPFLTKATLSAILNRAAITNV